MYGATSEGEWGQGNGTVGGETQRIHFCSLAQWPLGSNAWFAYLVSGIFPFWIYPFLGTFLGSPQSAFPVQLEIVRKVDNNKRTSL